MDFKGMGDTFQDMHPIMNVLGSGWVAIPIFILSIILAVILMLTRTDSKYSNVILTLLSIIIVCEIATGYSFIMKNFYATPYIYGGGGESATCKSCR